MQDVQVHFQVHVQVHGHVHVQLTMQIQLILVQVLAIPGYGPTLTKVEAEGTAPSQGEVVVVPLSEVQVGVTLLVGGQGVICR
jgi:hypothetical protein